ncbi:hypothetical protein VOLCADRAFT_98671 [Volvox carteri f. nagariensis]|uniref:Uncharacterized protein n=1 Tax=Volvox carteri f. nagariensis TaxID=3068 RepID=D8UFZ4_VOLCA|nr:uncharacterized protein VOLCADRAFT_98671 [Volvox carteri f. nagariensis]EFJ41364.1 hypothetical protein VOLCADRAFT_98671 [Volvox carteri f. nagariensis]|eukprot:XP_002957594.1 hypothetical protein VOLCADRAFT_98671 [Volvox carteri f. nagariensis]
MSQEGLDPSGADGYCRWAGNPLTAWDFSLELVGRVRKLATELAYVVDDVEGHLSKRDARSLALGLLAGHLLRCYAALLSDAIQPLATQLQGLHHGNAAGERLSPNRRVVQILSELLGEARDVVYFLREVYEMSEHVESEVEDELAAFLGTELPSSGLLEFWCRGVLLLARCEGYDHEAEGLLDAFFSSLHAIRYTVFTPTTPSTSPALSANPSLAFLLSAHITQLCAALDGDGAYGLPQTAAGWTAPLLRPLLPPGGGSAAGVRSDGGAPASGTVIPRSRQAWQSLGETSSALHMASTALWVWSCTLQTEAEGLLSTTQLKPLLEGLANVHRVTQDFLASKTGPGAAAATTPVAAAAAALTASVPRPATRCSLRRACCDYVRFMAPVLRYFDTFSPNECVIDDLIGQLRAATQDVEVKWLTSLKGVMESAAIESRAEERRMQRLAAAMVAPPLDAMAVLDICLRLAAAAWEVVVPHHAALLCSKSACSFLSGLAVRLELPACAGQQMAGCWRHRLSWALVRVGMFGQSLRRVLEMWEWRQLAAVVALDGSGGDADCPPKTPSADVAAAIAASYAPALAGLLRFVCKTEDPQSLVFLGEVLPKKTTRTGWHQLLAFTPLPDVITLLDFIADEVRQAAVNIGDAVDVGCRQGMNPAPTEPTPSSTRVNRAGRFIACADGLLLCSEKSNGLVHVRKAQLAEGCATEVVAAAQETATGPAAEAAQAENSRLRLAREAAAASHAAIPATATAAAAIQADGDAAAASHVAVPVTATASEADGGASVPASHAAVAATAAAATAASSQADGGASVPASHAAVAATAAAATAASSQADGGASVPASHAAVAATAAAATAASGQADGGASVPASQAAVAATAARNTDGDAELGVAILRDNGSCKDVSTSTAGLPASTSPSAAAAGDLGKRGADPVLSYIAVRVLPAYVKLFRAATKYSVRPNDSKPRLLFLPAEVVPLLHWIPVLAFMASACVGEVVPGGGADSGSGAATEVDVTATEVDVTAGEVDVTATEVATVKARQAAEAVVLRFGVDSWEDFLLNSIDVFGLLRDLMAWLRAKSQGQAGKRVTPAGVGLLLYESVLALAVMLPRRMAAALQAGQPVIDLCGDDDGDVAASSSSNKCSAGAVGDGGNSVQVPGCGSSLWEGLEWCFGPDGLHPRPDLIVLLHTLRACEDWWRVPAGDSSSNTQPSSEPGGDGDVPMRVATSHSGSGSSAETAEAALSSSQGAVTRATAVAEPAPSATPLLPASPSVAPAGASAVLPPRCHEVRRQQEQQTQQQQEEQQQCPAPVEPGRRHYDWLDVAMETRLVEVSQLRSWLENGLLLPPSPAELLRIRRSSEGSFAAGPVGRLEENWTAQGGCAGGCEGQWCGVTTGDLGDPLLSGLPPMPSTRQQLPPAAGHRLVGDPQGGRSLGRTHAHTDAHMGLRERWSGGYMLVVVHHGGAAEVGDIVTLSCKHLECSLVNHSATAAPRSRRIGG